MDAAERAVLAEMARHHGVISEQRVIELGVSRTTAWRRKRDGIWIADYPGVLRSVAATPSWHSKLSALTIATGGYASHRSAGALWELDGIKPGSVEITVARGSHWPRVDATVHESTQMSLVRPVARSGIMTTDLARTLIDLGAVVGWRRVEAALDDAMRRKLTTWPQLYRRFVLHAARGRNGIGPMRRILNERYGDETIPLSAWSRWVGELLVTGGLPTPVFEHRIVDETGRLVAQVDLAYPGPRVAIELQSKRFHLSAEAFERDAQRFNRLVNAGWLPLLFTWADYSVHPARLITTVRTALDRSVVPAFHR
jgi:hypothetical protein